jgi:Zn-dependent M16 (insulinase) family peptidase
MVTARLVTDEVLRPRLRRGAGVYAAVSQYDPATSVLSMLTFRDPDLACSLRVFRDVGSFLRNASITPQRVAAAVRATAAEIDRIPGADRQVTRALSDWASGAADQRAQWRAEVISATAAGCRAEADLFDQLARHGHLVALARDAEQAGSLAAEVAATSTRALADGGPR